MTPAVLVATWEDGLFVVTETGKVHELGGRSVRGLTADGRGGVLAIVDGRSLCRRSAEGQWSSLATVDCDLACGVATPGAIYLGTDNARVLRLGADHQLTALVGFERMEGRETWTAGGALVNGRWLGPPLGVRSISAAPDGTLLANVHVGGIPRSTDDGTSWQPTIEVQWDVHEVLAHPSRPGVVAAAAAAGLCISRDGGATWSLEHEGMHARYCSAVAFVGDDVWVAASSDHFAPEGRIYRRPLDEDVPLRSVLHDESEWTNGIVDTQCLASSAARVAFADRGGNLYVSSDQARSWLRWAHALPAPSSVFIAESQP